MTPKWKEEQNIRITGLSQKGLLKLTRCMDRWGKEAPQPTGTTSCTTCVPVPPCAHTYRWCWCPAMLLLPSAPSSSLFPHSPSSASAHLWVHRTFLPCRPTMGRCQHQSPVCARTAFNPPHPEALPSFHFVSIKRSILPKHADVA